MSEKAPKTRRRFLADLLFLGGGVTAASLLARSTLLDSGETAPAPASTPNVTIEKPFPRATVTPDGNVVEPKPDCEVTPDPLEPEIAGRMVVPREPNPAGGARPIEYKPGSALDGDMELPNLARDQK